MSETDDAVRELESMLDEGVSLELTNPSGDDYRLLVRVDAGCEDCLVPDEVLAQILTDALDRRGVPVGEVSVLHP